MYRSALKQGVDIISAKSTTVHIYDRICKYNVLLAAASCTNAYHGYLCRVISAPRSIPAINRHTQNSIHKRLQTSLNAVGVVYKFPIHRLPLHGLDPLAHLALLPVDASTAFFDGLLSDSNGDLEVDMRGDMEVWQ